MIRFRLATLIADRQFATGKRLTAKELSEATGINRMTLSRMQNLPGYSTSTDTLEKLCKFFGCDVGDLAKYVDDAGVEIREQPAIQRADREAQRPTRVKTRKATPVKAKPREKRT